MKKLNYIRNKKLLVKCEKPHLLHLPTQNRMYTKFTPTINQKPLDSKSLTPVICRNCQMINKNPNLLNIKRNSRLKITSTPIQKLNTKPFLKEHNININNAIQNKFQYKKLPFEKIRRLKIKLNDESINDLNNINKKKLSNIKKQYSLPTVQNIHSVVNKKANIKINNINKYNNLQQNYYDTGKNIPINFTENEKKNKKILLFNEINKPLWQLLDTKGSSIGSKLETREMSGNTAIRSKSSLNSPQIVDFNNNFKVFKERCQSLKNLFGNDRTIDNSFMNMNYNSNFKQRIIKYLDKTIKELKKIKTIIQDDNEMDEYKEDFEKGHNDEIKDNKFKKIDLNEKKYNFNKNNLNINNKNIINYNFRNDNNKINKLILNKSPSNIFNFNKLNKTISYDELKFDVKEKQKYSGMEQKSFNNIKKTIKNRRTNSSINNQFNTVICGDEQSYKEDEYSNSKNNNIVRNVDHEVVIPKLIINKENSFIKINENEKNKKELTKDRYIEEDNNYNDDNTELANFEFSD